MYDYRVTVQGMREIEPSLGSQNGDRTRALTMVLRFPGRLKQAVKLSFILVCVCTCGLILKMSKNMTAERARRHNSCGTPKTHVFFLRIPKTGTSTTTFIFWRFAIRHNVSVLLPRPYQEETYSGIYHDKHEVGSPPYGIVANQLIYNPTNFLNFLPRDMKYIAQLRHPFEHLTSVLHYSGHDYSSRLLRGGDLVKEYLRHREVYEKKWGYGISLTNNPYAMYFGLDRFSFRKQASTKAIIARIDREFSAVMILEQLDESLIMMRRILCWSFEDIIYKVENVNTKKTKTVDPGDLSEHAKWASTDYAIYNHFVEQLHSYIQNGGDDFKQEVLEFRSVIKDVHEFCESSGLREDSVLRLPGGLYYDPITYTAKKCRFLSTNSTSLRNIIRKRQGLKLE